MKERRVKMHSIVRVKAVQMYYGVWVNTAKDSGFSYKSQNRAQAIAAFRSETCGAEARGYKRVRLVEVGGARETVLAVLDEWRPEKAAVGD